MLFAPSLNYQAGISEEGIQLNGCNLNSHNNSTQISSPVKGGSRNIQGLVMIYELPCFSKYLA